MVQLLFSILLLEIEFCYSEILDRPRVQCLFLGIKSQYERLVLNEVHTSKWFFKPCSYNLLKPWAWWLTPSAAIFWRLNCKNVAPSKILLLPLTTKYSSLSVSPETGIACKKYCHRPWPWARNYQSFIFSLYVHVVFAGVGLSSSMGFEFF